MTKCRGSSWSCFSPGRDGLPVTASCLSSSTRLRSPVTSETWPCHTIFQSVRQTTMILALFPHSQHCLKSSTKLLQANGHFWRSIILCPKHMVLLQVTKKIYDSKDIKQITLLTLRDLSKAFGSVNHILLGTLITIDSRSNVRKFCN